MHFDRAEYFDVCWAESAAVRDDDGLSDVADLDMAVLGRGVPAVTRPARGDGRSAGPPARSPLRSAAAGAKASLSWPPAAPPGSWPPDSRRLSQPLLAAAARPWVTLDDVTSADTWRRPIGNPGAYSCLETVAVGRGIGPAACLLSYGTWAAADPRSRSSSCLQHTQSAIEACTH